MIVEMGVIQNTCGCNVDLLFVEWKRFSDMCARLLSAATAGALWLVGHLNPPISPVTTFLLVVHLDGSGGREREGGVSVCVCVCVH